MSSSILEKASAIRPSPGHTVEIEEKIPRWSEMRTKKEKPAGSAPKIQHSTLREYFVTTVQCTIFALFVTTYVVHP